MYFYLATFATLNIVYNMDIKKVIKKHGWTLEKVASKMNISQPSLSSIINGNPTLNKLQEIASIIGISVSELLADEGCTVNGGTLTINGKLYDVILREK